MRISVAVGVLIVALAAGIGTAQAESITIANAGFETPATPGSQSFAPSVFDQGGSGWVFTGQSGIAATGGGYTPFAPSGDQAGFIQRATGDISQSLMFGGGIYALSFLTEWRADYGANPFQVLIDATVLTFSGNPVVTPTTDTSFLLWVSDPFFASAGSHVLRFDGLGGIGMVGDDVTSFIDDVAIEGSAVPEPSSLLLLGGGLLAVVARFRGRRRCSS